MNELQVFSYEGNEIRTVWKGGETWWVLKDVWDAPEAGETEWHGFVYAVELGDSIKIGHTTRLRQRLKSIAGYAQNYSNTKVGNVAFSVSHTNHKENEKILHDSFSEYRTNKGELFGLSLNEFFDRIPLLAFKDESKEKQGKADVFFQRMKAFVSGCNL
ncbi:MAG: GIY-YIG nuclease family protein [Dethiobacter sp.]|nr:GIY-YIG nuclease family protein [Dethiobacter sp.]